MICTLLRRVGLLPGLVLFLLALGAARPAHASHILGGELTYRYLDANGPASAPLRYELSLAVYVNCNSTTSPFGDVVIGIYDRTSNAKLALTTTNYSNISSGSLLISQASFSPCVPIVISPGCTSISVNQPYSVTRYLAVVNLPTTTVGYYAEFTSPGNYRNASITNLASPSSAEMTLFTAMAPPSYTNRSPVFASEAVAIICANDTTYLLNNAVDADGDSLVYTFGRPQAIPALPATFSIPPAIPYVNATYSATTPLGTAPGQYASINPRTGLAKYRANTPGNQFVVAIDVREYRNIAGAPVLIGTTRRDIQLVVGNCPPSALPVLPTASTTGAGGTIIPGIPRTYTVEAGGTLTIPLVSTQANGNPLALTGSSILLDGPGGYDAVFGGSTGVITTGNPAGSSTVTATGGTLTTSFVFKPSCTQVRAQPYDLALKLVDQSCAGKTSFDIISIKVVKPAGPTTINGDVNICGLNTVHTYSSSGGTAPKVSWRVVGGTFVNPPTNNPVLVQWTRAGTGLIVARGIGADGCPTDSVSKTVTINPTLPVGIAGIQTVCQGTSTSLSFTGSTSYTLTGGGTTQTGAGPFTVTPTATTIYTVSGVTTGTGCPPTSQVTVTVLPGPTANAGPPVTVCSGVSATIGAAPVTGYTYSWSPATGLSNPNIANPTVTLTNTGAAATTTTYTLTALNANFCPATSSVVVTVNPAPSAITVNGPQALCGTPTTATYTVANPNATSTYQWTLTGGTITAGQGTSSITVTYPATAATATITVTETTGLGCVGQPVTINVNTDFAQAPQLTIASVDPTDNTKVNLTISVPTPGSATTPVQIRGGVTGSTLANLATITLAAGTTTYTYTNTSVNAAQNSYQYSLSRTNGCGTSLTSPTTTTILLKAQLGNQNTVVNLNWNAYQGFTVDGYRIYRQDGANGTYNLVATVAASASTYVSTNTGQSFNQCFRIVAFSNSNASLISNSNTACVAFEGGTSVANIITPNGDGLNDKLVIRNAQLYPGNSVTIFNRWGRQVFATTSYNNDTNSWGADESITAGVYYYLLQLPDGTNTRGWVEVVK